MNKVFFVLLCLFTMGVSMPQASIDCLLSTKDQTKIEEILSFWFGTIEETPEYWKQRGSMWFKKDPEFDTAVRNTFERDIFLAATHRLNHWCSSPKGRLALIILLDQFPRNVYRDTPKAFSYDPIALRLALEGLDKGADKQLHIFERFFFYLPFQHAEHIEIQELSMEQYKQLHEDAPGSIKDFTNSILDYAGRHHAIIERFGRFPHRNQILNRESSSEELEFLTQPGSSF